MDTEIQDRACPEFPSFDGIYSYCFKDNQKFMDGWRKVQPAIPDGKLYDSLIKAQVFFYSREVGTVDYAQYQNWLKHNQLEIKDKDLLTSTLKNEQTMFAVETDSQTEDGKKVVQEAAEGAGNRQDKLVTECVDSLQKDCPNNKVSHQTSTDNVEDKHKEFYDITESQNVESASRPNISPGKSPANFLELVEMIENGMQLPDTEDINIEPINEDPSPSATSRPKKPWEVDS